MATPLANPERQFQTRRDTSLAPIHNIYTFYKSESSESESESEDIGEIDIETLTLEQYLTLNNTHKRISNLENATFEIKGQFLRELRKTTFSGSSTENAIEHIGKVLEVANLFNTNDCALLRIFPLTLFGVAKRWLGKTSSEHAKNWDELKQNFIRRFCPPAMILEQLGEILSTVKLNARCSAILQNELPPKEKDPRSFILPGTIGTTTVSNALADLGASISIMPFSLFKRLGLGNPKPINMVIEMANRSLQSPKGIVENVLVKINKFIFPVDFIILDIVEDDKVPIILKRPMLTTAHARIEQITFDINERESYPDDDLGIFPNDDNLSPNLENYDTMFLSPPGSTRLNDDSSEMFCNPNSNSSISMDDFVKMDDVWDNLDFRDLTNEATKFHVKPEFLSSSNRIHLQSPYNL
ncbi:retrovirus-related pol polyprotein from transposon TNT 1-94 [Tanacetum coccineum]